MEQRKWTAKLEELAVWSLFQQRPITLIGLELPDSVSASCDDLESLVIPGEEFDAALKQLLQRYSIRAITHSDGWVSGIDGRLRRQQIATIVIEALQN